VDAEVAAEPGDRDARHAAIFACPGRTGRA
jgi:hypothetical protein